MTRNQKPRMAELFPIRATRTALALLVAASVAGAATPSFAQSVPIPKPAPKARDTQTSASDGQRGSMTTGTTPATPPNPVIPDPRRNVPASLFATFDDKQKAQAAKVSSLSVVAADACPEISSRSDPTAARPGASSTSRSPARYGSNMSRRPRSRSSPTDRWWRYATATLTTQDIYPLSQTPLRYLLSDRIDLMKDTNVVSVTADDLFISVTIEEKQMLIGTSRLMLMVGRQGRPAQAMDRDRPARL